MRTAFIPFSLLLFFLCSSDTLLICQDSVPRPRVGLALSGGGAKGFAHIGVLKVLEEIDFPVDCITGTSMGSIVGGLYAIGYSAGELENIVLEADWEDLFDDRVERRSMPMEDKIRDGRYLASIDIVDWKPTLPTGMITGQKISAFLSRLTWQSQHIRQYRDFPVPFACVATDIQTGEAVVLDSGNLAESLRASMSIPTIFTPVRQGGRLLVDGLISRNLPAEDAKHLGADIVIGVDVSTGLKSADELKSMIEILDQSLSFQMVASTAVQRGLCDALIEPDFGRLTVSDFIRGEEIIRIGEEAARRALPQLIALRDSLNRIRPWKKEAPKPVSADTVLITKIKIEGAKNTSKRLIRTHLGIRPPARVTPRELEEAVLRVYGTGIFERVTYHLEPALNGTRLLVRVSERPEHKFQFGFRYNTYEKATVLLNTTFRNLLRRGSVLRADLKLSTNLSANAAYTLLTEIPPRLGMNVTADYEYFRVNLYEDGEPMANFRMQVIRSEMLVGSIFSKELISGVGISRQWYNADKVVGAAFAYPKEKNFHSLFGLFFIDTYNKTYFPTRGFVWFNRFDWAGKAIRSNASFRRFESEISGAVPVHRLWSVSGSYRFAGITAYDLIPPLLPQFGGHDLFMGLYPREYTGRYMKMVQASLQLEWLPRRYLAVTWNMGQVSDRFTALYRFPGAVHGAGITLGAETLIGPVELSGMTGKGHPFLTYLNIGYKF